MSEPRSPSNPQPEREEEWREEFYPSEMSVVSAVVAVGSIYAFFLVFAQYGLLRAMTAELGVDHAWLRPALGAMAAAGIGASAWMVRAAAGKHVRAWIVAGFILCGLAAGGSWVAHAAFHFLAVAVLTGAGVGLATVGLAAVLRLEVGGERLGLYLGIGTGIAYALANLPPIFAGSPHVQAAVGIAAACLGVISLQGFAQRGPRHATKGVDYDRLGVATWVALFTALVALDSAAFYVIQHDPELRHRNWSDGTQLFLNSGIHLGAAIVAGLALDRRRVVVTLALGAALLVYASLLISGGSSRLSLEALLYAAGVSIYSVVLVFYPARSTRPWHAALVYSIAGWLGSAGGVAFAGSLWEIPRGLPLTAGAAVVVLFAVRAWRRRRVVQK